MRGLQSLGCSKILAQVQTVSLSDPFITCVHKIAITILSFVNHNAEKVKIQAKIVVFIGSAAIYVGAVYAP